LIPRCSLRSLSLFAAAFVVIVIGAPGSRGVAQAGCGDYVHVGGTAPYDAMTGDAMTGVEMTGNHAVSHAEMTPFGVAGRSGPPPCQGPSCRQNPFVPLEPAPLPVSQGFDHKACLVHDVELPRPAAGWALCEASHAAVDFPGLRIERPPRLGSS
jgi:hypothetical protein